MEKFSYLQRGSLEFIEQEYQKFLNDPDSVHEQWRLFFEGVEMAQKLAPTSSAAGFSEKELQVHELITAYRLHGHLVADLNPLDQEQKTSKILELSRYGLSESDLDQPFQAGSAIGMPGSKLKDIVDFLKKTYGRTLTCTIGGCEPDVQEWFRNEFEKGSARLKLDNNRKRGILYSLIRTETLERFIHTRFVGTKRFSIEGGDALMPMLETLVNRGTALGVKEIVIGMAHRGRVNVLANFMGKDPRYIFADFDGKMIDKSGYAGDVKYHLGHSADKNTEHGDCHISLAFNPSHLEFVNPVATGICRAKQRRHQDTVERRKVIPVLIHGDAAFAGQGVVQETLQLSQLDGYKVGGTIHIIINNQVGFTTGPKDARSTRYSSDAAKSIKAPVLLVNGDDVEACVSALDMALRFRQEFRQDVVIDLICYRRYGHNEGDEPSFTQPLMYEKIRNHPTLKTIYAKKLADEGVQSQEETDSLFQQKIDNLQKILEEARQSPPEYKPSAFEGLWKGLRRGQPQDFDKSFETSFPIKKLHAIAEPLTSEPKNFNLHPKVKKLIESRRQMIENNQVDWGMAELLSYASLLTEGNPVRISGQDCERGTFSHRHSVYYDIETGQKHIPLCNLEKAAEFCVYNSLLSEAAVLGFEYGNAIADPTFLTIWEAQFGDFANGAQVIIDQFLSSGEEKWARMVGLTLLLPHGYEGQGPEHSSARLERFLQLAAGDSMQVCNITTPANLFHVFRRQIKRDFRKPLVIMSPKSLLRHPKVVSTLDELATGPFTEVLPDLVNHDPQSVEKIILCSGKVFYDLDKYREENPDKCKNTAIVRLEQIAPFPAVQLTPFLNGYKRTKKVYWVQEEPENMGAYTYVAPKLRKLMNDLGLENIDIDYIGRTERTSPAVGSPRVHVAEQELIIKKSFE